MALNDTTFTIGGETFTWRGWTGTDPGMAVIETPGGGISTVDIAARRRGAVKAALQNKHGGGQSGTITLDRKWDLNDNQRFDVGDLQAMYQRHQQGKSIPDVNDSPGGDIGDLQKLHANMGNVELEKQADAGTPKPQKQEQLDPRQDTPAGMGGTSNKRLHPRQDTPSGMGGTSDMEVRARTGEKENQNPPNFEGPLPGPRANGPSRPGGGTTGMMALIIGAIVVLIGVASA